METKYSKENPEQPTNNRIIDKKTASEDEIIKITDLSDYCLEQIFDYLDYDDWLNIGLSNTTFQYAAGIVFKRKYKRVRIWVRHHLFYRLECAIYEETRFEEKYIEFESLFLVFGDFISSIYLCCSAQDGHIPDYQNMFNKALDKMSRNSLGSLVEINFLSFPRRWMNKFLKPFPKVEYIDLVDCDLTDESLLLSEIFPNIHCLSQRN